MRTSGGQEGSFSDGAERPQSAMVFRQVGGGVPYVVAGQVDVLPSQRREMGEPVVGDVLHRSQGGDGALEIARVPEDDRGHQQVQAGGAVLLVLVRPVADFAEPVKEDRARQTVAGLALVELPGWSAASARDRPASRG